MGNSPLRQRVREHPREQAPSLRVPEYVEIIDDASFRKMGHLLQEIFRSVVRSSKRTSTCLRISEISVCASDSQSESNFAFPAMT